jgi:hypothetical protein
VRIEDTIAAIQRLEEQGVISRYAVGGAVGATFYLEPIATMDVDVFITVDPRGESRIASLQPIFESLVAQGATVEGEHVVIAGWPVQFLPAANSLLVEAVKEAVEHKVGSISARVFTAEHLAAVALQTGRAKDKARLLQFLEAGALDFARFESIVNRHNLGDAWMKFQRQFLTETS